ncbi:Terpene cyclase [Mycena venus]|uniref:Terpene synthase n=1 Tax=Mycena venus TaxID=2733690 RepID=A0A8H7CSN2_9AGAR|nr:Terpene cyclase [Mycena venus]
MPRAAVTSMILPDLQTHCTFPFRKSRYHKFLSAKTKAWFFRGRDEDYKIQCATFKGLKPALLAAVSYPTAGYPQLRLCSDFLTYFFFLDDLSGELDKADTKSVADVVLNLRYHPYTYRSSTRISEMAKDIHDQAQARTSGGIPTLEEYIILRRDTSGCKTCWALIECGVVLGFAFNDFLSIFPDANNLDIPEEVHEHPVIRGLSDSANDAVAWANDLYSYKVESSRNDTHNMVVVVMDKRNLDLRQAVDLVGKMCEEAINRFKTLRTQVLSWRTKIEEDVAQYIQGMADWMVAVSVYWSFETERYFGKANKSVKSTRIVQLSQHLFIPGKDVGIDSALLQLTCLRAYGMKSKFALQLFIQVIMGR